MLLPGLGGPAKFNAKVDADSIMATLARSSGATLKADGGVMFTPFESVVVRKATGTVKLASGIIVTAENFFKLTPWQDDYARKLVMFLNYDLHHDGNWAVMWLNPTLEGMPTEIRLAYQDEDGDVQFVIESDRTLVNLQQVDDVRSHGENAEQAYMQYKQWLCDVDVQDNQKIKAAQGQQQFDPTIQPLV